MKDQELAKEIARHLDDGLNLLNQSTLNRLKLARKEALNHYHAQRTVFGLAWAGHSSSGHSWQSSRFWLPTVALILALAGTLYWQSTQQNGDAVEIDAALLAGDLPLHAYFDEDFNAWLESSS
jgi:hypothetical protein